MTAHQYVDSKTGWLVIAGDEETVIILAGSRLDLLKRTRTRLETGGDRDGAEIIAAIIAIEEDALATLEGGGREAGGCEVVYAVTGPQRDHRARPTLGRPTW